MALEAFMHSLSMNYNYYINEPNFYLKNLSKISLSIINN